MKRGGLGPFPKINTEPENRFPEFEFPGDPPIELAEVAVVWGMDGSIVVTKLLTVQEVRRRRRRRRRCCCCCCCSPNSVDTL